MTNNGIVIQGGQHRPREDTSKLGLGMLAGLGLGVLENLPGVQGVHYGRTRHARRACWGVLYGRAQPANMSSTPSIGWLAGRAGLSTGRFAPGGRWVFGQISAILSVETPTAEIRSSLREP
jgi:hypothetical protein